jgi:hypothetical protein
MPDIVTIALDYSHNNKLVLESSSYNEFTHFLFTSGYKLGKIEGGMDSVTKLEQYDCVLLSSPTNAKLTEKEIEVLEEYVKNGGSLLILSSMGGDVLNKTNLNELTHKFGFEFVPDGVEDSVKYVNLQKRPLITNITPHVVTEQVKKLVLSSACSLKVLDFLEDEKNIKIETVARGGLNTWHRVYDGADWIGEDAPKIPMIVAIEYYKGKVVSYGNLAMYSSLGREYGFSAFDNNIFIANTLKWLTSEAVLSGKVVTVNLQLDLFYWANKILKDQKWENVSDVLNVALKYFKDHYKLAIDDIKKLQEEKIAKRIEYEKKKKEKMEVTAEDKILEMVVPERKKEDLLDIMSALEEATGEKYEVTIDLEEAEAKKAAPKKKPRVFKTPEGLEYTIEDTKKFNKSSGGKHAIWHGKPTKTFIVWLQKKK